MKTQQELADALVAIKAVKDIGADYKGPDGKWVNDAAAERDLMYQIACEALQLPASP